MKKLAAIFFLLLICMTNVSGNLHACVIGYEWSADADEPETKNKGEKKEAKEFTSIACKNFYVLASVTLPYQICGVAILPQPTLDKPSPPPDLSC